MGSGTAGSVPVCSSTALGMPSPSGSIAPSPTPSPSLSGIQGCEPVRISTTLRTPSRSLSRSPSGVVGESRATELVAVRETVQVVVEVRVVCGAGRDRWRPPTRRAFRRRRCRRSSEAGPSRPCSRRSRCSGRRCRRLCGRRAAARAHARAARRRAATRAPSCRRAGRARRATTGDHDRHTAGAGDRHHAAGGVATSGRALGRTRVIRRGDWPSGTARPARCRSPGCPRRASSSSPAEERSGPPHREPPRPARPRQCRRTSNRARPSGGRRPRPRDLCPSMPSQIPFRGHYRQVLRGALAPAPSSLSVSAPKWTNVRRI